MSDLLSITEKEEKKSITQQSPTIRGNTKSSRSNAPARPLQTDRMCVFVPLNLLAALLSIVRLFVNSRQ
jgi:hypothetical protein